MNYQLVAEAIVMRRLITEVYPTGMISRVCDSYNLWDVVSKILPVLKEDIMSREGKVVIRPDSGDPVDIICGDMSRELKDKELFNLTPANKGVIQLLWDIFGGTINDKGYKVLDPHIGAIYGDAITLERANTILARLETMGFASTNIVFGVGSYTYQYNTQDTFGFAMKSTFAVIDGEPKLIFKDPITDNGLTFNPQTSSWVKIKKSQKGRVYIYEDYNGKITYSDGGYSETEGNMLETIFENGELKNQQTLADIRDILSA